MFSVSPANVWVDHRPRLVGEGQYNFAKLAELSRRILFNYSAFPLRLVSLVGMVISGFSFLLGAYYVGRAIFVGISVPGWTTVVVLLSFFNGITILILSMLGEYTVRLLQQINYANSYQVKEIIRS